MNENAPLTLKPVYGAPKYSEFCLITSFVLNKNITILYNHQNIATGMKMKNIKHIIRINPVSLSPVINESNPKIPPINSARAYTKNAICFLSGISFANTPAAIPFGPNPGTPRPKIFTTSLLNITCVASYNHHVPNVKMFTISLAINVKGERKYKWSRPKNPPSTDNPNKTSYDR